MVTEFEEAISILLINLRLSTIRPLAEYCDAIGYRFDLPVYILGYRRDCVVKVKLGSPGEEKRRTK